MSPPDAGPGTDVPGRKTPHERKPEARHGNGTGEPPLKWDPLLEALLEKLDGGDRWILEGPWEGGETDHRELTDSCVGICRRHHLTLDQTVLASEFFPKGFGSLRARPGGIRALITELWLEQDREEAEAKTEAEAAAADRAMRQPVDFLADQHTASPELRQEHCPEALWPFVTDTSERMGVEPASVMLSCLVTCASVMTDDWQLQPRRHDYTWMECARLWGLLLGPPSILKTPVIYACTKPIDKLDEAAREQHKLDMRAHKIALAKWKKEPGDTPEPTPPKLLRYMIESTSIEAFTEVLRDDDEGRQRAPAKKVLCRQDEMSEFVANQDKYGGGKGGDQGAYLRLYNGGRHSTDRIIRGAFAVPNWSACFLAGIQPGPIQKIAKAASEDGMLQRFMYAVPGLQTAGVDRVPNTDAIQRYHALIPALSALHPPRHSATSHMESVILHCDAHQHREAIDALAKGMAALPDTSQRLQAAFGKWPGLFARLCLTFHLVDVADAGLSGNHRPYLQVVPEKTARQVAAYMRDILLPHLLRADATMFATAQTGHARWIAGYILARKLNIITTRDVIRAYRDLRAPECRDELKSVMASLVAILWLEPVEPENPVKPVSTWTVNPLVHIAFGGRGERERKRREEARAQAVANFETLRRQKAEWDGGVTE